jgi:pimeloyl-ACP methyl ester carboxylesterase
LKRFLKRTFFVLLILYSGICVCVYFFQEKLIFFTQKLSPDFVFRFDKTFKELNIKSETGNVLNCLLFQSDTSKGLVIYFHGNAGSLESWGTVHENFLPLHYDVLIVDYAGYGKSTGTLSEDNLFKDAQAVYSLVKENCAEGKIIIYGRSIGTGIAANLASENHPQQLILESPYISMKDISHFHYPFLPTFILRYPLRTDLFLPKVKCPVTLIHGTDDEVIYFESSLELKKNFKPGDTLYTINRGHHNDLKEFEEYHKALSETLK